MNAMNLRIGISLALLLATAAARAQPVIKTQPRSLAVLLGETAEFSVVASPTPASYQWYHDTWDMADATNATLTISNITLVDLGSYTVVVQNEAGQTNSQPAWLKLARWTEFAYFGDSECQASYGNGPTWGDYLPDRLCLRTTGKRIYFTANASEADVRSQIQTYLAKYKPSTNTLVALWKGGMAGDVMRLGYSPARSVSNRVANLTRLADAGVTHFLVPTMPSPRLWPMVASLLPSQTFSNYDRLLNGALTDFAQSRQVTVYRPDMAALEEAIWADPAAYGFTNLTSLANSCSRCDRSKYYTWDGFHPTTAANKVWSQVLYGALVPPLIISEIQCTSDSNYDYCPSFIIRWRGGSSPFQLQLCDDLTSGLWISDFWWKTFQTDMRVAWGEQPSRYFFRVLQLGQ